MNSSQFAATVRAKYPGAYDDMDDNTLTQKIITKYPQYKDMVDSSDEGPGMLKSAALGAMSGVPGAETVVSGLESLGDKTYEQAHKDLENQKDQAWANHPVAYGGGKTAGMVGTALAVPASIPAAIGIGAASGLDSAANSSEMLGDAAKGGLTGAALGTIGEKVISPALEALPGLAKSGLASLGSKTTTEDIQNYLNNPEAIRSALNKTQLGERVAGTVSDIGSASGQLSNQARALLDPTKSPLDIRGLKDAAMSATEKYFTNGNAATGADETAVNAIVDQYQKLAKIAETNNGQVPEDVLRSMIDRMQAATKENTWGNPEASASQTALKEFSGRLNDILRSSNPDYAEGMQPAADLAKLSNEAKSHFKLEPNEEGVLSPTDATTTKLANVTKEGKTQGEDIMSRLKGVTGQDLQSMVENSQSKERFDAPGAGAGLKALLPVLGYGAGRTTGVPFAGIIGAGAGHYAANALNGGNVAKGIMDMYIGGADSYANSAMKPLVDKFGPVLANAAKQGGTSLAATHFVLATSNPEYQKLVDHVQNNQDGQ